MLNRIHNTWRHWLSSMPETSCSRLQARFKDQLEIQALLENAGWKLKRNHGKDVVTMQAELPSTLATANLDKRAFVPITNPRLAEIGGTMDQRMVAQFFTGHYITALPLVRVAGPNSR